MKPDDLPESSLLSALNGARIAYLDGRLHENALVVANEVVICITSEASDIHALVF